MTIAKRGLRRAATTLIALGLATGATLATTGTAYAYEGDGDCERGDVCLFWGGNLTGAYAAFYYNQPNHGNFTFPYNGSGGGENVKNNVASARNRAVFSGVRIFYNENYNGGVTSSAPSHYIGAGGWANLNPQMRNNNASHRFGS